MINLEKIKEALLTLAHNIGTPYAEADGRKVTKPEIDEKGNKNFDVTGLSGWNSTSKYKVTIAQNPDSSYYEYSTWSTPEDDASAGSSVLKKITVRGNDPERLKRYESYSNLPDSVFKTNLERFLGFKSGGKLVKVGNKIITLPKE